MTQHKSVLTKEAKRKILDENMLPYDPQIVAVMNAVEQAALAKLTAQEPVIYRFLHPSTKQYVYITDNVPKIKEFEPLYAHPMPCISPTSDKTACVSENAESDMQRHLDYIKRYQKWRRGEDKTMSEAGLEPKQIGESLDWIIDFVESDIPNAGKMVAPHGYRLVSLADIDTAIQRASVFDDGGDGADPESARSCIEILKSMISSKAVDSLEPRKEVVHDRHTGRESLYTPPVGESLYSMAQARKESFSLALSVDTKKVQALLQSYLDSLEGWQLVPKEPTEEMHHAARDWSVEKYGKAIGSEASHGCYQAMLAAAPKHKGSNDD